MPPSHGHLFFVVCLDRRRARIDRTFFWEQKYEWFGSCRNARPKNILLKRDVSEWKRRKSTSERNDATRTVPLSSWNQCMNEISARTTLLLLHRHSSRIRHRFCCSTKEWLVSIDSKTSWDCDWLEGSNRRFSNTATPVHSRHDVVGKIKSIGVSIYKASLPLTPWL